MTVTHSNVSVYAAANKDRPFVLLLLLLLLLFSPPTFSYLTRHRATFVGDLGGKKHSYRWWVGGCSRQRGWYYDGLGGVSIGEGWGELAQLSSCLRGHFHLRLIRYGLSFMYEYPQSAMEITESKWTMKREGEHKEKEHVRERQSEGKREKGKIKIDSESEL